MKYKDVIPTDIVVEWLQENDYITEHDDGSYSWNITADGGFKLSTGARSFANFKKITWYRSANLIRKACAEMGLTLYEVASLNKKLDGFVANDKPSTPFGKWFVAKFNKKPIEDRGLYYKYYGMYRKGELII